MYGVACSRPSDSGVRRELRERGKSNEEERTLIPYPTPSLFSCSLLLLPVPTIYVWRVKKEEQLSKEVLLLLLINCMGDNPRISCLADSYSFFLFFPLLAGFLWKETFKRKHN